MNAETMMHWGDATAVAIILGWIVAALPPIATLLTIIWMGIRIYETKTVQDWIRKGEQ